MDLHSPANGPIRGCENSLLDDLEPLRNRDLIAAFFAEPCLNRLLPCGTASSAAVGPCHALRPHRLRVSALVNERELALEPCVLQAARLWNSTLGRLLFDLGLRE